MRIYIEDHLAKSKWLTLEIIDDVLYYCYKELSTFMITYHYEQTIPNVYCAL